MGDEVKQTKIPESLKTALDYIKNAGGSPKLEWFIEDFQPVGEHLRIELYKAGLAFVKDGCIYIPEDK